MGNRYSLSEYVKNVYGLIMTKLTMRQARFVRRPIYIRGHKSLAGCNGLTTGRFCRFDLEGTKKTLFIGNNCEMGDMTHIVAHEKVEIGENVLVASKCFISDTNHGEYKGEDQDDPKTLPNQRKIVTKPVKIGNNVWIGENTVILSGTEIGDGCIIGANSVVKGTIPSNVIAGGSPAKLLKKYDQDTKRWKRISDSDDYEDS